MKKYVLFFISIGVLICTVLVYSTINTEKNKKMIFSESGYILNGSKERYYFGENETYTPSYNEQIVFYDTEGAKVTLGNNNFVHYTSGNVTALQDSVLLDLNQINANPIIYYNVSANKEIKKISNRYSVKNLDKDLQFEQAIWKISPTKYIILSNQIKVTLNNGMTKEIEGYIEIEYFDNEIVNIYNQEFSYQTISSDSYLELGNNIKVNLGTKIVSRDNENKMALEDMVINSDDNVTLVDLNQKTEEPEPEESEEDETEEEGASSSSSSTSTTTTTTTNNSTVVNGEENDGKIEIDTPEILYEYVAGNENKVDETVALAEPQFKFEDMVVTATGISGNIKIEDEEDLLSKNDNIQIKIMNNSTGKVVYTAEESYGVFNILLDVETLMPNTSYSLIATATYTIDEKEYTKNFLYKTFVTSDIGVAIKKEAYTDTSLSFIIEFDDELVDGAQVSLLDSQGNEINNRKQEVDNEGTPQIVTFESLNPNTEYIVRVSKIIYEGIIQEGENWQINTQCQTLKTKAEINKLNYSVNKRDGTFRLYIEDVKDADESIQNYTYIIYRYTQIQDANGNNTLDYDTENIAYQRQTTNKEITITVADEFSGEKVVKGQYYGFKVIATTYDNEKNVDVESNICGTFILNGAEFPSVKFEREQSDYPPTEIRGWLYIIDNENTITVDTDNPLTITYYSDVDEGEVYVRRTDLQTDERTIDSSGNEVIKIFVNLGERGSSPKGLKAETSYTFSVYGTVDLKDGNEEYKNVHIGSAIVTTGTYAPIVARLAKGDATSSAFTVELSLQGDNVSKEGLESINIMLYEGSGDINVGEYENWTRTITRSNYGLAIENAKYDSQDIDSLQDLLFDNTLLITPSFIAGGRESNYTEANYQVVVTATVDGTNYTNKIPIETARDDDENTGDTTYINPQTRQRYTASYIIVDGKGTTSGVTQEMREISAYAIPNREATRYNLNKCDDLLDSTIVGYNVSTQFSNTGSLTVRDITYYVWDQNGNPVLGGNGEQITQTLRFANQDRAPSAVFELGYGTTNTREDDNSKGLYRGNAYYFSYTVTYVDPSGNTTIWPISESNDANTYTNKSLRTNVAYADKQEPSFVLYPKTSNETSITYAYSCTDPDKALYYQDAATTTHTTFISLINEAVHNSDAIAKTDGQMYDVTFNNLYENINHGISYRRNLNKARSNTYETKNLITQRFEGIQRWQDIRITDIKYNERNDPNNIKIYLSGQDISRIAAAEVTLKYQEKEMKTKLLKLSTNGGHYINVSLLDFVENENFKDFIGNDIQVKTKIYYDSGRIGYEIDGSTGYSVYTDNNNEYFQFRNNNFTGVSSIDGNMYASAFTKSNASAQLNIKSIEQINSSSSGDLLQMLYTSGGLKYNDKIIVAKEIVSREIDDIKTINVPNLTLGVEINSIKTTISTAKIKGKIVNPLNIDVDEFIVEICHSRNREWTPDWNNCETQTIDVNDFGEFELTGLTPAEYYKIRFKYEVNGEYVYTYDVISRENAKQYEFETLATIGINNLEIEYDAQNYKKKYINISYGVDRNRSNMYEKTKYEFFEADGVRPITLTENNIEKVIEANNYEIVGGALIVENSKFGEEETFEEVLEKVKISPEYNVFTMGQSYIVKITPMVTSENAEYEIESISRTFELKELVEPTVGLKMERMTSTTASTEVRYIRVQTTIRDNDKMIYGSDYGEYTLHVYKYRENRSQAVEVNIYDRNQGGDNITGNTFNLREHASRYPVYIQESDLDYSYNYYAELTFQCDKQNNGTDLEERKVQYSLRAIQNDVGISIGSLTMVKNGNLCEVRFYDSYSNIDKINKIDYTIVELSSTNIQSGSFVPVWTLVSNENEIPYYKLNLPIEFTNEGIYTIQMNLYSQEVLIDQTDTTFMYQ